MARRPEQLTLHEETLPLREGNPLFCHQEFLEKMEENRGNTVGRRAALLLQRLLVDLRRQYYKPTQGDNRGWRRSPLGGNHGNHFYAWWAPRGAAPLKTQADFDGAPEGAIFLRDIRHHDDHRVLNPQSLADNYLPIGVKELWREDYVPAPWTPQQAKFADSRQKVRVIKGFPGSGKTTALWHAADLAGRKSILYITYSPQLAALARDHFDKFAPASKSFVVVTYADFVRQMLGDDSPFEPVRKLRPMFVKEISGFSPTILGPWAGEKAALYDEIHAHLLGATLPYPVARFAGFPDRKISARQYRDQREQAIGRAAAEAVVEVCDTLRRRDPRPVEVRFFKELDLAWNTVRRIRAHGAGRFAGFDCIAIDEVQDLTPIEALAIVELASSIAAQTPGLNVLVAGDEAQTVRPTDFEWGWFHDLLHHRLASPQEFKLQTNLRSPRRIAALVNRAWELYGAIDKSERPSGTGLAEIDENAGDQLIFCGAKSGPELEGLLEVFSEREGLALIAMGEVVPAYVPERLRDRVLTTFEAKGLDFQSVCVLDPGKWLDRILHTRERGRGMELDDLSKRLAIDQLRVALSRPAERLYWIDVDPAERTLSRSDMLLSATGAVYPMVPAVLLKTLEEETLDPEERVRLCESDAHQFLSVRPALAASRARQAVALLGEPGGKFSVPDPAARASAHLTLCQVAFTLAFQKVSLPSEIGRVDLYAEAVQNAQQAGRPNLGTLLRTIGIFERETTTNLQPLLRLGLELAQYRKEIDPWLLTELQSRSAAWLEALEERGPIFSDLMLETMPVLYRLFVPMEAEQRSERIREKTIRLQMSIGNYAGALKILQAMPGADAKWIAECRENLGELDLAAAEYLKAGSPADALRCYRSIPDFDKTLSLLETVGKHPARESLEWVKKMRDLAAQRPAEFSKQILPAEKQLLEELLQTALGVTRKKPAAKKTKTAVKKAASPKKKP